MVYLRTTCGISRMDRMRNKVVYERFMMAEKALGVNCGIV